MKVYGTFSSYTLNSSQSHVHIFSHASETIKAKRLKKLSDDTMPLTSRYIESISSCMRLKLLKDTVTQDTCRYTCQKNQERHLQNMTHTVWQI